MKISKVVLESVGIFGRVCFLTFCDLRHFWWSKGGVQNSDGGEKKKKEENVFLIVRYIYIYIVLESVEIFRRVCFMTFFI